VSGKHVSERFESRDGGSVGGRSEGGRGACFGGHLRPKFLVFESKWGDVRPFFKPKAAFFQPTSPSTSGEIASLSSQPSNATFGLSTAGLTPDLFFTEVNVQIFCIFQTEKT